MKVSQSNLKPFYESNGVVLYCGDAREILSQLNPACASLCLTDAPYGCCYITNKRAKRDPLRAPITGDESLDLLRQVTPLIDRVMQPNSHLYFFASSNALLIGETGQIVAEYWKLKNTLIWHKGLSGTMGDVFSGYGVNFETIIYANKGRRKLNGSRPRSVINCPWSGAQDPVHPTVKPVMLLQDLIRKSSNSNELVIDPFCGSGTTLLAARNLGRRTIGIELSEEYCAAAVDRLESQTSIKKEKTNE